MDINFTLSSKCEDIGKIADWTNLLNANRLHNYTTDGNLNVPQIIELIGEQIPYNDVVKPYQKLKTASSRVQFGQNKKFQKQNQHKSQQKPLPSSYLKMFSSRRRGFRTNQMSHKHRRSHKNQTNISEIRIFPTFVMVDSSWQLLHQFTPADFEPLRETVISIPKVQKSKLGDIPLINKNYKIISPKCPIALKKVMSINAETIDHQTFESFTHYNNDESTHIYLSSDCLAILLAHQSSIHSFHLNVSSVGPKQIHVTIGEESPFVKGMVCGSSPETIAKVEQENAGDFWRLCQEETKLNVALRKLCFKYDESNDIKAVPIVNTIKMGSKMTLQVLGYAHGALDNKNQLCHLRTIMELPQKGGTNTTDWKNYLDVKKMSILLNENMKNRFQIIRWNISALFSGVDQLCLAYTSRKDHTSNALHSLLQVESFDPQQYLDNLLSYDLQNRWDHARVILKKTAQLATTFDWNSSGMVIYYEVSKDYEKNALKIFGCPLEINEEEEKDMEIYSSGDSE
ncbi:MAG: Eukaryotic translation initiation factor 3 subunit D [Marteilia pararefringens]